MKPQELRIGNLVEVNGEITEIAAIDCEGWRCKVKGCERVLSAHLMKWEDTKPIPLTEEWLVKFGFSILTENSAGKQYGYVVDHVFDSNLTLTYWETTKDAGKFFRGKLEIKLVHQLQNLFFALTGEELELAPVPK